MIKISSSIDRSPVFDDILQGRAPKVKFKVNNHTYRMAYYLTDGIYPNWVTFIQSIKLPQGPKAELFAELEDERHRYIQIDTSEYESGESSRSSKVKSRESVNVPMLTIHNQIRDPHIHERLKADLVENVWEKYGNHDE
uniref:Uncharacterized protein n=1 Tax=Brassica oleracea var. oleracea TaxID=109376 RepID=A0A0D3CGV0_BRAOL